VADDEKERAMSKTSHGAPGVNCITPRPSKPRSGCSNHPGRAERRFWSHVDRSGGPGACWPWLLSLDEDGYGLFYPRSDRQVRAHRFALQLKLGRDLDPAEVARHGDICTTRACANPDHLSVGTQADNVADRDRLGRTVKGARHWNAKLTAAQVDEVRELIGAGMPYVDIAPLFGVGREAISKIARSVNWRSAS
jgi:hypothetical protein